MAEIRLYDYEEIIEDWFGSYSTYCVIGQGKLSAGVIVPLIEAVPEDEEITVKINSVGGSVFDGWSIYNALKAHKANVIVRIEGIAASIASIIAMSGDSVIICQAAMLMIHKPTIDPFWCGSMNAEDLKREAQALDKIQAVLNSIYVNKTGLDAAAIDSMINAETWITPSEAISMGFANSVENTITETTIAENAFRHIFKNADAKTRAYANSIIKTHKNMSAPDLKAINENIKQNNSLMDKVLKFLNLKEDEPEVPEVVNASSELEDGTMIYFEGELAVDTAVFTDEEMTVAAGDGDHTLMDGRTITVADGKITAIADAVPEEENAENNVEVLNARIAELEAQNSEKDELLNAANTALQASNEALTKIKNIKSNFTPEDRKQNFSKPKSESAKAESAYNKEEVQKRKEELKSKNNK